MLDNKYDRINTIASKEADRDELARAMAAYERQHGKVKTTPIMRRDSTGNFHNIEAERINQSRRRGRAKSAAATRFSRSTTPPINPAARGPLHDQI